MKILQIAFDVLSEGGGAVDDQQEGEDEADDCDGRETVCPDVHAFVVHHEKTAQDAGGSVEIDPVAVGDR